MKLSEQITNSCCGVLADKAAMVKQAQEYEELIAYHRECIDELKGAMMEIGSE